VELAAHRQGLDASRTSSKLNYASGKERSLKVAALEAQIAYSGTITLA